MTEMQRGLLGDTTTPAGIATCIYDTPCSKVADDKCGRGEQVYTAEGDNSLTTDGACEPAEPGEEVYLQYSTDDGVAWVSIVKFPIVEQWTAGAAQDDALPDLHSAIRLDAGDSAPAGFRTTDAATTAAASGINGATIADVVDLNVSSASISKQLVVNLTVNVPAGARKTGTRFRWAQRDHSSAKQGLERGAEGLYYQWRYRELFDQWALDDVILDMALVPPTFTSSGDISSYIAINVIRVTVHTDANNVVLYFGLIPDAGKAAAGVKPGGSIHSVLSCPSTAAAHTALVSGSFDFGLVPSVVSYIQHVSFVPNGGGESGGSAQIDLTSPNTIVAIICPSTINTTLENHLYGSTISVSPHYNVRLPVPMLHPHVDVDFVPGHPHPHVTLASTGGVLQVKMTVANTHPNTKIFFALSNDSANGFDAYPPIGMSHLLSCDSPLYNETAVGVFNVTTSVNTTNSSNGSNATDSPSESMAQLIGARVIGVNTTINLTSSNIITAIACRDGIMSSDFVRSGLLLVRLPPPTLTWTPSSVTTQTGLLVRVDTTPSVSSGYPEPVHVRYTLSNETDDKPSCSGLHQHAETDELFIAQVQGGAAAAGAHDDDHDHVEDASEAHGGYGRTLTPQSEYFSPINRAGYIDNTISASDVTASTKVIATASVFYGALAAKGDAVIYTQSSATEVDATIDAQNDLTASASTIAVTTALYALLTNGMAVTYTAGTSGNVMPLVSTTTYYAVKAPDSTSVSAFKIVLFNTNANALAATMTDDAAVIASTGAVAVTSTGSGTATDHELATTPSIQPLVNGVTYYAAKAPESASAFKIVLFDTKAHADAATIDTDANLAASTGAVAVTPTGSGTATDHQLTLRAANIDNGADTYSYSLILTSNVRVRAVVCPDLVQAHAEQSILVEVPSASTVFSVALEAPTAFLRCDRFESLKLHVWLTLPRSASAGAAGSDQHYDPSVRSSRIHYEFVPATSLSVTLSVAGGASAVGSAYYTGKGYASEAAEAAALCASTQTYNSQVQAEVGSAGAYTPFPPGSASSFFSSSDSSFDSAWALPDGSLGGLIFDGAYLDGTLRVVGCSFNNTPSAVVGIELPVSGCCAGAFLATSSVSSAASTAYTGLPLSSCSSSLLFEDNFSTSCATITSSVTTAAFDAASAVSSSSAFSSASPAWRSLYAQWGGAGINGGVHPDNVRCAYETDKLALLDGTAAASTGAVLELLAHGDMYSGTGPIGVAESNAARGVDDPFLHPRSKIRHSTNTSQEGWAWAGYTPVHCSAATNGGSKCAVRRVGAAIQTTQTFAWGGVVQLRMKPCATDTDDSSSGPAWGTSTGAWLQNASKRTCRTQREYIRLWQAALRSGKAPACDDWMMSADSEPEKADGKYHDYTFHWSYQGPYPGDITQQVIYHASSGGDQRPSYHWPSDGWGRVAMYIDSRLLRTFVVGSGGGGASEEGYSSNAYTGLGANSDASPLTIGHWFPDSWAGAPGFGTCATRVASVRVLDSTVAQERWCSLPRQHIKCGLTSNVSSTSAYISSYYHDVGSDYHAGISHRPPPPVGGGVGHSGHECEVWVRENCLFEQALPAVGNRNKHVYCETWREQPVCWLGERTMEVRFDPYYDRIKLQLQGGSGGSSLLTRFRGDGLNSSNVESSDEHDRDFRNVSMYTERELYMYGSGDPSEENGTASLLTFTTETAGAEIFYTTDGTEPALQAGGSTFLYDSASPPSFAALTKDFESDLAVGGGIAGNLTHNNSETLAYYKWLRVRVFARQAGLPLSVTTEARYAVELPTSTNTSTNSTSV
jgi:hypothetical protein